MKIHLDTDSGIAGNMFLAACLDLGLPQDALEAALATLNLSGWSLEIKRERRGGICGLHLEVVVPPEKKHRHLPQVLAIIDESGLSDPVKKNASAIFRILAEAEGAVHGIDPQRVHFHEVGAVDAIIDICGSAFAAWHLGFTEVTATAVPVGTGTVQCQHGRMSIPVPAVAQIFSRYRVPIKPDPVEMELVTPTGAAILVHLVDRFCPPPLTRIDRMGYGLGTRELPGRGNAVRLLAQIEKNNGSTAIYKEPIAVLSSHLDDMNPEWYGPLWQQLFAAGALDVALIPMTMKKGRPGIRLEVVAPPDRQEQLAQLILKQTTTLGVRVAFMDRYVQPRTEQTLETPWGELHIKLAGEMAYPEHESLVQLAQRQGWSLPEAQRRIAPLLEKAILEKKRQQRQDSPTVP